MGEYFIALILGLVEGLTEFLPVSSTGHLIVVGEWLGFHGEKASTFEIFIQSGAILAVVVLFWPRFVSFLNLGQAGEGMRGRTGVLKLALACTPFVILGAIWGKHIKAVLFNSTSVAIALIVGGIIMLIVSRLKRQPPSIESVDQISFGKALAIGACQCAALWPGISRSGATLVGATLLGVGRVAAAEFSFLLAVPILFAASAYDLLKNLHLLSANDLPMFAIGFVVSFVSAIVAIKAFLKLLSRWGLEPFAWYRILLGAAILAFWV